MLELHCHGKNLAHSWYRCRESWYIMKWSCHGFRVFSIHYPTYTIISKHQNILNPRFQPNTTQNNHKMQYSLTASAIAALAVSVAAQSTITSVTATTTASIPFGSTLSNGAYVCNPAHSYPGNQSCDGSGPTPTLVTVTSSASIPVGSTLSNGAYVCNPAHSYPAGQSCDGSGPTPTLVTLTTSTATATTTPASIPFGSTLSNGAYVCNPAHSYPGNQSCDGSGPTPTLVTVKSSSSAVGASASASLSTIVTATTARASSAAATTAPAASRTTSSAIATFTGAASDIKAPAALGALFFGVVAFLA